jgi:hypothetical protein
MRIGEDLMMIRPLKVYSKPSSLINLFTLTVVQEKRILDLSNPEDLKRLNNGLRFVDPNPQQFTLSELPKFRTSLSFDVPKDRHEMKNRLNNGENLTVPTFLANENDWLEVDIQMFQFNSRKFTNYTADEEPNSYPSIRLSMWKKEWNELFSDDDEDKKVSKLPISESFLRDNNTGLIDLNLIEDSDILATIKNTSSLPVSLDITLQLSLADKLNQNANLEFEVRSRLLCSRLRPEEFELVLHYTDLITGLFKGKKSNEFESNNYITECVFNWIAGNPINFEEKGILDFVLFLAEIHELYEDNEFVKHLINSTLRDKRVIEHLKSALENLYWFEFEKISDVIRVNPEVLEEFMSLGYNPKTINFN